jgi:hypothetical protein
MADNEPLPNPLVKISRNSIRIYYNGLLHLDIPRDEYRGLQSWLWGDVGYIEFSVTDAPPIKKPKK